MDKKPLSTIHCSDGGTVTIMDMVGCFLSDPTFLAEWRRLHPGCTLGLSEAIDPSEARELFDFVHGEWERFCSRECAEEPLS